MFDPNLFKHFVPTQVLPPTERAELARHCHVRTFPAGVTPFRRNTASNAAVYLLAGEIELVDERGIRRIVVGTDDARHPLSNAERFVATATCVAACELLFIDRAKLEFLLTWAQSGTIEVNEIDGDDQDWMGTMLQCPAMQLIPPANIARVLSLVEPLVVVEGETIISQGAPGDAYYVLTQGRCQVLRADCAGAEPVEVVSLSPGDGFGEEALLSGDARNATVRATEECRLVRLGAADFAALLKAPLLRSVKLQEAPPGSLLVDVRVRDEYAHGHLPGAISMPLRDLRDDCQRLPRERTLVVYCDGGQRSAAATFLLCERGFDALWCADGVPAALLSERDPVPAPAAPAALSDAAR